MVVSGWQTKFNVSPGLWSLVLGPFGPDLGPYLTWDLGPGPELDNYCLGLIGLEMKVNVTCDTEKRK